MNLTSLNKNYVNYVFWKHFKNAQDKFTINHSCLTAGVMQELAKYVKVNDLIAYSYGLLHDIGKFDRSVGLQHNINGFRILNENNLSEIAEAALLHNIVLGSVDKIDIYSNINIADRALFNLYINEKKHEAQLIKLLMIADNMCLDNKVVRFDEKVMHEKEKTSLEYNKEKLKKLYEIKKEFEANVKADIYDILGVGK